MKRLVAARRSSQILFLALFVAILWTTTYPLNGILPPSTFFSFDPLLIIATSVSTRVLYPTFIFACAMIILTVIFGRFFCGWICPLGATIDLIGRPGRGKSRLPDARTQRWRVPKYFALLFIMTAACAGIQIAWALDPIVVMGRFVSLNLIPGVTYLINTAFVILIKQFGLYGPVYDIYRSLKSSFLGIHIYYFSHSMIILACFVSICCLTLINNRFWCRTLCPLGALYATCGRSPFLRRRVSECTRCAQCRSGCRMAAITDTYTYIPAECVLCMDCVYDCPERRTSFSFKDKKARPKEGKGSLSRGSFLALLLSPLLLAGFKNATGSDARGRSARIIRPPGVASEDTFLDRCVRCGNCMKVCITNGLQPTLLEAGWEGIWTPRLVPEIGYCEYTCTLCGATCPTSAIPKLTIEEKHRTHLGLARIDRELCIPWAENNECLVCEEHCPVPEKAIKLTGAGGTRDPAKPYIDENLCVGCGICQNKCPVRPDRAIQVVAGGGRR